MEEALRCRAVGVVIGEIRSVRSSRWSTRRLSLAAAAGDTLGLFCVRCRTMSLPPSQRAGSSARLPRSAFSDRLAKIPASVRRAWRVRLVRNRRGHLGAWIVEWNSVEQRFELATDSEPMAGAAFDRPHRAAVA